MLTLYKKELNTFLNSLMGYIVLTVFVLVTGLFLWVFPAEFNILDFGYASMDGFFTIVPFIFLFIIPAITMRSFADERKTGTIELLTTQPISDFRIIIAKLFAGTTLITIALLPTLVYFVTVYLLALPVGNMDTGGTWGSYIGLFLLGASMVSIGVFSSSITDNQIVAFLAAVFISGFLYVGFDLIYSFDLFGKTDLLIKSLGMNAHYTSISRGVVDTRDLIYFLSIIAVFVLLTKLSLGSRKW